MTNISVDKIGEQSKWPRGPGVLRWFTVLGHRRHRELLDERQSHLSAMAAGHNARVEYRWIVAAVALHHGDHAGLAVGVGGDYKDC